MIHGIEIGLVKIFEQTQFKIRSWKGDNAMRMRKLIIHILILSLLILFPHILNADPLDNWIKRTSNTQNKLVNITYDNNMFVVVGGAATILTSLDGGNWDERGSKIDNPDFEFKDICYENSIFVAVGGTDNAQTCGGSISTDGVNWEGHPDNGLYQLGITYGNGVFVTTSGLSKGITTSTNGIDWIPRGSPDFDLQGIIFVNEQFFAVGASGTILIIPDLYDDSTWIPRTTGSSEGLHSIAYGNGTFVAVGVNGTILTSKDNGDTWPLQDSKTTNTIKDVTYGNGTFVAVGSGGTILSSTNGIEWVKRTSPVSDTLMGAIYGNNTFIAVGLNGTIIQTNELNELPVANADGDQTVNERITVILDGSGSYDLDGDPLTYIWMQIAGTPVSLDLTDPIHPTFTAPEVPAGGETLTFQLTVNDGQIPSEPASVNITIKNVNHPPVAIIESVDKVAENSPVSMSGEGSYDEDLEPLTYYWEQISGPPVADLSDPTAEIISFTTPFVGQTGATLTFKLTVSDGIDNASDTVDIFVENVNHPPIANAGDDQTRNEASLVTLDGIGSGDPDGDLLTFNWTQISGTPVTLSDPSSPTPSFTAPLVSPGGATFEFRLIVDDGLGETDSDEVTISVLNINDPPNCGLAKANPAILWPPNHSLVPIKIVNLTDPNNDQVSITVTGVTQDEPLNGLGDGDTSPDAVINGGNVLLRAERAGMGNGRVYRISFRADDSFGEGCTGSVTLCVPHDKRNPFCGDDGQIFDSLTP